MKKTALILGVIGLGVLGVACRGGQDAPGAFEPNPVELTQKLEEATGSRWAADPDATGQTALYLAVSHGRPAVASAKEPGALLAFLDRFKDDLGVRQSLAREFGAGEVAIEATDEELAVLRFQQHVPGTDLPVFDAMLSAGVEADGTLGFVQTSFAKNLDGLGTTPAITPDGAERAALATAGPGAMLGTVPTALGVSALDREHPRLAYRVVVDANEGPLQVDVDAVTGEALSRESLLSEALAFSARSAYKATDPRHDGGATLEVNVDSDKKLRGPVAPGTLEVRAAATAVECTAEPNIPYQCDHIGTPTNLSPATAVDAYANLTKAAKYFQSQHGYSGFGTQGHALGVVANMHINVTRDASGREVSTLGNAFFSSATNQLSFGDGKRKSDGTYATYPPATSLDFVAHEYAHGVTAGLIGLSGEGEPGALNEALADIFAAQAEALMTNSGAHLFGFADDLQPDGKAQRHFLHPSWGVEGGAVHYSQRKATVRDPKAKPDSRFDNGHVHYNSTIGSQAWALLAWGGFNDYSKVGVVTEVGLSKATRLVWGGMLGGNKFDTFKMFADRMIGYQLLAYLKHATINDLEPVWVKNAIVCAWNAVGVIPDNEAVYLHNTQCPKASEAKPRCAGKADGVYCNPDINYSYDSYECKQGATRAGMQCPNGTFCHRQSGSPDSLALVEGGRAKCFDSPQN